jgi:hypothetical protein
VFDGVVCREDVDAVISFDNIDDSTLGVTVCITCAWSIEIDDVMLSITDDAMAMSITDFDPDETVDVKTKEWESSNEEAGDIPDETDMLG